MATPSRTDVSNLALMHIGDEGALTDVDTDTTKQGRLCRLSIDNVREALLRSFIWNFAKKRVTLTLPTITNAANNGSGLIRITKAAHGFITGDRVSLSEVQGTTEANGTWTVTVIDPNNFDLQGSTFINTYVSGGYVSLAPAFEYLHQHALPADFLRLVNLETPKSPIVDRRIEVGFIVTDDPVLELMYIFKQTDHTKMDPLFYEAYSLKLAIAICYAITQSNKLRAELMEMFNRTITKARFTDSIEDPMKTIQANEWLFAREGGDRGGFVRDPMT